MESTLQCTAQLPHAWRQLDLSTVKTTTGALLGPHTVKVIYTIKVLLTPRMIAQCCVWITNMTETFVWSVQWSYMATVEMTPSVSISCQIDYIRQASNQICVCVQSQWKECTITNVFYRNIVTCIKLSMGHRGRPHLGKGHQAMSQKTSVGGCYLFLKLGLFL